MQELLQKKLPLNRHVRKNWKDREEKKRKDADRQCLLLHPLRLLQEILPQLQDMPHHLSDLFHMYGAVLLQPAGTAPDLHSMFLHSLV